MPADLTRAEIDAIQDRFATDGDPTHDDVWTLIDYARSTPTRLAAARAEGYREGVEAIATALRQEIPTGDGSTRSLTWSEALDAVDAIRALSPPPAESAQPSDGWIEWKGRRCPVNERDEAPRLDLRFRDGTEVRSVHPSGWRWSHMGEAGDIIAYRIVKPAEPSAPVAPDWPTRCAALEADGIAARKRVVALEAENAKLREGLKDTTAHLVAAHSLLSRTPRAKKAAPSNTMFDMMLRDYETSCERARALLQGGPDATV